MVLAHPCPSRRSSDRRRVARRGPGRGRMGVASLYPSDGRRGTPANPSVGWVEPKAKPIAFAAGSGSRDDGFRCALPILRAALGEEPEKSPGANTGLDSSSRRGSVRVHDLGAGDQVMAAAAVAAEDQRSEEHTSELPSLRRIAYAV